ncbi:MAG TPA: hypothetical protein VEC15_07465 [Actinomycetota bacterium]|nr:hypothetical protein [Actinomycetota bacterium]
MGNELSGGRGGGRLPWAAESTVSATATGGSTSVGETVPSSDADTNAASSSEADANRAVGSFSRHRRIAASSSGGTGRRREGGVTGSFTCW